MQILLPGRWSQAKAVQATLSINPPGEPELAFEMNGKALREPPAFPSGSVTDDSHI